MDVYVRAIEMSEAQFFTECEYDEIHLVIERLKMGNGVYFDGDFRSNMTYQYVLDGTSCYAEIILEATQ